MGSLSGSRVSQSVIETVTSNAEPVNFPNHLASLGVPPGVHGDREVQSRGCRAIFTRGLS